MLIFLFLFLQIIIPVKISYQYIFKIKILISIFFQIDDVCKITNFVFGKFIFGTLVNQEPFSKEPLIVLKKTVEKSIKIYITRDILIQF